MLIVKSFSDGQLMNVSMQTSRPCGFLAGKCLRRRLLTGPVLHDFQEGLDLTDR